jgi:hypothetical protein
MRSGWVTDGGRVCYPSSMANDVQQRGHGAAPLAGIRVLEVANWLAVPAAGMLLADLGADVIKVEPPGGEVFRNFVLNSMGYRHQFDGNVAFEVDNRGKRSSRSRSIGRAARSWCGGWSSAPTSS